MQIFRILIVDDEKNLRLTLFLALESSELEIETAINGDIDGGAGC